ncbi:MAG: hypothetical protein DVB27_01030 [Verrucomicrobia bacterium]|nr:MAG: hypothetical protein DVB27_01030 [Verrucomicrobiota bacterium]
MSKTMEQRFWRGLAAYERLTDDESVAIRARDFDAVEDIHSRKPALLDELCVLAAGAGLSRRTPALSCRIERLTTTETANAEAVATMLGAARRERQNLELARQRLRSLSTLYGPEPTRQQSFCVHG